MKSGHDVGGGSIFIVVLSAVVVSIVAVVLVVAFSDGSHGGSTTTTTAPDEPSTTTTTAPDEPSTTSKDTSAPVTPDDSLRPDDVLRARRSIASSNQRHTLQMTEAGVLMAATDGEVWWRQAAPYRPGSIEIMQNDGNFVVYGPGRGTSADNAMWSSGTSGHDDAGASLVMRDVGGYGRIAIRTPNGTELWSTQDPRLPPATTTKATKGTTTT